MERLNKKGKYYTKQAMKRRAKSLRGLNLAEDIVAYCTRYGIPVNHFLEIINDQKVLPMLRGKGTEFSVLDLLREQLSPKIWRVEKLNLNPQPGILDEDIVAIHLETSIRIIVESKNAVRNSFSLGTRANRDIHFKVKCHKSRSFLGKDINDRYRDDEFDVLFTNPSNSLILPGERFELVSDPQVLEFLTKFYASHKPEIIFQKANLDWRVAVSKQIAIKGVIPRTPVVLMGNNPYWVTIDELDNILNKVLKLKVKKLVKMRSLK